MKWTKKQVREELKRAYEAPEPKRKQEFFGQLETEAGMMKKQNIGFGEQKQRWGNALEQAYIREQSVSRGHFMLGQLWYIKKWVWVVSSGIFFSCIGLSRYLPQNAVWILSALTPFLALMVITENAKSNVYDMEELECATRFSLRNLLLARMGALAVLHSVLLVTLVPICARGSSVTILKGGLYILVPYFLTVSGGFFLMRSFRGRESTYLCGAVSMLISLLVGIFRYMMPVLYTERMVKWWILGFCVVMAAAVKECFLFFRQTEELSWS